MVSPRCRMRRPSASTTQETCGSPRPSTAGSAVSEKGPVSTGSHVSIALRLSPACSSSAFPCATARFSKSLPPGQSGSCTVASSASAAPSAPASVWSRCRWVTRPATAVPSATGGTIAGSSTSRARSPSAAKVPPGSASGSITKVAPSASTSTPAQPSLRTLISSSTFIGRSYGIMADMPRRSAAAVAETRAAVLESAVDRASVEGLEGLTLGALAGEVEMRKSSVFSLFGSKQDLQLATLEAAADQFTEEVWGPVADEQPGLPRLLALCDSWLDYHRREMMPGGCFLTTATIEYDARPGPLRDEVAQTMRHWLAVLAREGATAIEAGDLAKETDPADVAFQLNALAAAASYGFQLCRGPAAFDRARRSMRRVLGASER